MNKMKKQNMQHCKNIS